jgi:hypothetical protein
MIPTLPDWRRKNLKQNRRSRGARRGENSLDSQGFEGFVALSKQTAEIVAQMAATRAVAIHHGAVLLVALAEKGLIDPRRVFAINEDVATEFEQLAQEHAGDGVRGRVHAIVAQALRELEVTSRSLAAPPAEAGGRDRQRPGKRRAAS